MLSQHTRGEAWRQGDATATCPGTPGIAKVVSREKDSGTPERDAGVTRKSAAEPAR